MNDRPHVSIVDDDDEIRSVVEELLQSADQNWRISSYARAENFLANFTPDAPGCIILDVNLPDLKGLEVQHRLAAMDSGHQVIYLTGVGDVKMAVQAMKTGAFGFVEKPFDPPHLVEQVRAALEHDRKVRESRQGVEESRSRLESLTEREKAVLDLVVEGFHSREIADELKISANTVENHRARIMRKSGAGSVAELVRIALTARSGTAE